MGTLKQTPENELMFIGKVVKKSLEKRGSTWDMTITGALTLGIASKNNPGMALYMLDKIDPQPNSVITDGDVVNEFPFGFVGDWDSEWDKFSKVDQRRVFKK